MPTVQAPVQLTVEHLLSAAKQLSPEELGEFTRQLAEWQRNRIHAKPSEISLRRLRADDKAGLIQATQARLPQADEQRLKQLSAKSERGTLTEKELEEYRALAQQAEQLDVKRTEALAELVKLSDKPVHAVMQEIGWEEAPFG
ncbi:MAG: hypothetical protein O7E52_24030 [Candidatus Poribacteria bacterium]|nr:hypothetical protein [Candidatus Poribacteria bacterium]